MAIINIKNKLSGLVGTVVVRELNGKAIMQSRPKKHKKSKAVQDSSTEFMYASRFGKDLRGKLTPVLMQYQDANMYRRFLSALYKTLQKNEQHPKGDRRFSNTDLSPLIGFDFNINSPWREYVSIPLKFTHVSEICLELEIPELSMEKELHFPDNSSQAELIIVCHSYTEDDSKINSKSIFKRLLQNEKKHIGATTFQFDIAMGATLVFVVATVFYENKKTELIKSYVNNPNLHPCQLVYATNPKLINT